jgi:hypothetical protein
MLDRQKAVASANPSAMDRTREEALVGLKELICELLTILERKPAL